MDKRTIPQALRVGPHRNGGNSRRERMIKREEKVLGSRARRAADREHLRRVIAEVQRETAADPEPKARS